jgi:hypothetical protein
VALLHGSSEYEPSFGCENQQVAFSATTAYLQLDHGWFRMVKAVGRGLSSHERVNE